MPYEFRLRFHLLPDDRLAIPVALAALPAAAAHLRLAGWKRGALIEDSHRVFLIGGPYTSEDDACADGQRAQRALLLWALQRRLPVDLGDGRLRTQLTPAGVDHFARELGGPVRQQLHGLDVYEIQPNQVFVDLTLTPGLKIGQQSTVTALADWYTQDRTLSDRQALASELYCAAHFDTPFRSRFLTLMTSLEALLEYSQRPAEVVALVKELEDGVRKSQVLPAAKQSLLGSLQWLHQESIGQAGERTADAALPGRQYDSLPPGKYFRRCYELRSQIVHSGRVPDDIDLLELTNVLHGFVGDLLHATIGVPPP